VSIAVEFNRCALCGGELPKREPWMPGGSVFCESCRSLAQRESAIHGACLAMSRFLVWVWCEARWQEICESEFSPLSAADPVAEAIESGLLRIDWSRS
jgi:hypothetical protein